MKAKHAVLTLLALLVLTPAAAHADPKPSIWGWWPEHWNDLRYKPYIDHSTQQQTAQWRNDPWEPTDWEAQREGGRDEIIQGFYTADIIRGQFVRNNVPGIEVGPGFYMLGGQDKRRVVEMIDYTYGVTANNLYGSFMLYDWQTKKPIGSYSQYGLQLQ